MKSSLLFAGLLFAGCASVPTAAVPRWSHNWEDAQADFVAGRYGFALLKYQQLLTDTNGSSPFCRSPQVEEALTRLGDCHVHLKQYDKAIEVYTDHLDHFASPSRHCPIVKLGDVYMNLGRYDQAVRCYLEATQDIDLRVLFPEAAQKLRTANQVLERTHQ